MNGPLHIVLAIVAATLAGAAYAGVAGLLKAITGAHEVISTIMLNWIAVWVGSWLVGQGGALQSHANGGTTPISNAVAQSTHLRVFWGSPVLQGLDVGVFFALAALLVYSVLLNRTTLGFELRAVGFNPEAARYAGMSVARTYVTTMAIAGAFAGLAGAIDVLGWEFQLGVTDIQTSQIGFIAIAVAVLGRNRALGVFFSALLFGALLTGTSTRNLDPTVFRPDLAGNLTLIIQGLVVLFVGADVLILWLWNRRRSGGDVIARLGIVAGALAFWLTLPPLATSVIAVPHCARGRRGRVRHLGDREGRDASWLVCDRRRRARDGRSACSRCTPAAGISTPRSSGRR